jgi:hypothetical protein
MLRIAGALPPLPHSSPWRFAELGIGATVLLRFPMQEPTNIFHFQSLIDVSVSGVFCPQRNRKVCIVTVTPVVDIHIE